MEQLVLGLFKEQLSKFIVGFNQDKINANLLNGKGEITDVELNCALLNQELLKITPYAQLDRVHLSRLSFHVDSWTNLRKSPIHVDVGHISAQLSEPFHYVDEEERDVVRQVTMTQLVELISNGAVPKLRTTSYNLLDRIVDNLSVEVKSLTITFQPVGKFKTRCQGPWTPPAIRIQLDNLKWVIVNEFGQEDTAENVWRHNHDRRRSRDGSFFIYKKFECQYKVSLVETSGQDEKVTPIVSCKSSTGLRRNRMEVQVAMKRRIRDGEYMAVQVDVSVPLLDVEIHATTVPLLAHFVAAMQYCMAKDRSFVDPLKASVNSAVGGERIVPQTKSDASLDETSRSIEISASPALESLGDSFSEGSNDELDVDLAESTHEDTRPSLRPQEERPLLVTPNGMVFHEKVSFSFSVQQLETRCIYSEGDGQAKVVAQGLAVEGIWPKVTNEKGGYLQMSLSFLSIQEEHGQRTRQILVGGSSFDRSGPIEVVPRPLDEVRRDESFPLFEDRSVRPDPLQLRHSFPLQAFGCKATVGLEESEQKKDYVILVEALLDQFSIALESKVWGRFLQFLSHSCNGGFDKRWYTGDWTDILTLDMLLRPSEPLILENHLQHVVPTFLDENDLPSSEFLNANVKLRGILIRLPAAIHEDSRSCDIILQIDQSTLVVSSSLPVHLMENNSRSENIQFPRSKSDQVHSSSHLNDTAYSSVISTIFRAQCSCSGLSVRLSPALCLIGPKTDDNILLPCSIDLAVSFEGGVQSDDPECDSIQLSLVLSMVSTELQLRVNADRLFSAACTIKAHADNCMGFVKELVQDNSKPSASDTQTTTENDNGMLENTMEGRRIRVQKQIVRGRQSAGFRVALWFVVDNFNVSMWRRNVPRKNPLKAAQDATSEIMPELCLLECVVGNVDFGGEYSGLPTHSVFLATFSAESFDLKVAQFSDMLQNDGLWRKAFLSSEGSQVNDGMSHSEYMLSLLRFGALQATKRSAISFRGQYMLTGESVVASAAIELESGSVNIALESLVVASLLIAEALASLMSMAANSGFKLLSGDGSSSQILIQTKDDGKESGATCPPFTLESFRNFMVGSVSIRDTNFQIRPSNQMDKGIGYTLALVECNAFMKLGKYVETENCSLMRSIATSKNETWANLVSREAHTGAVALSCRCCTTLKHLSEDINIVEIPLLKANFDGIEANFGFQDGIRILSAHHINHFLQEVKAIAADSTTVSNDMWTALSTLLLIFKEEKQQQRSPENPINLACRSAVASIQSVKQWLQTVNHTMSVSTTVITDMFEKKQVELDALQLLLFSKEKERLSSLARNEPDMTGWLRVGAARRTGQRGMLSGTLWPYWAVLRKSILFLFVDPSDSSPSEIIALESASIHSLLGGKRRHDLKRSAAIVDMRNNIHFIVANSDLELESWSQRIQKAISLTTTETTPTSISPSINHRTGPSNEQNGPDPDGPRDANAVETTLTKTSLASREPSRNRFSSVLSAARQKGKEVAERTKQRLAAPAEAITSRGFTDGRSAQSWTCEACTYADNAGTTICKMCGASAKGSRSRNSSVDSDAANWVCSSCTFSNNISSERCEMCSLPMTTSGDDPEKNRYNTTDEMTDNRPALRERFGAAVRMAKSKGKALATNISREVGPDAEPKALELRNIMLDSSLEIATISDAIMMHSLEGTWKFSVCCQGNDEKQESSAGERGDVDDIKDNTDLFTLLKFEIQSTRLDSNPINSTVSFAQVLKLHREISEAVSKVPLSAYVVTQESHRTKTVHMSERTEALLGITAVDMVRSTARTLGGMVGHASRPETWPFLATHVEDFFDALSSCPLPLECLGLFTDLLQLPASTVATENKILMEVERERPSDEASFSQQWHNSLKELLELSSLCEVELLRAENQSKLAEDLTQTKSFATAPASSNPIQLLQPSTDILSQMNEAMRATLIRVMEERDEAQARCISRDVLHSHELELERRRTALVETKLAALQKISEESNLFSNDKDRREFQALRRQDRRQQEESDAELMSLCQQLSSEISARTQADLEVSRLKEIRTLELENQAKEKQALQDEIVQLRNQISREKQRSALLRKESGTWRESFEDVVRIKDALPPPPPVRKLPPEFDRQSRSFDR